MATSSTASKKKSSTAAAASGAAKKKSARKVRQPAPVAKAKVRDYITSALDDEYLDLELAPHALVPLRLSSLFRFGTSVTKFQFDPLGNARVLPGVITTVPGNPVRLREGQQCIAFSQYVVKPEAPGALTLEVLPNITAAFGLLPASAPVIMGPESPLSATMVHAPDGAIGFSFYTTRPLEISVGVAVAYLRISV